MTFNEPMSQCVYFAFKILFYVCFGSFHEINIFSLRENFKRNVLKLVIFYFLIAQIYHFFQKLILNKHDFF
jgi:hypothetical protein